LTTLPASAKRTPKQPITTQFDADYIRRNQQTRDGARKRRVLWQHYPDCAARRRLPLKYAPPGKGSREALKLVDAN
jgi:hypothetical protein